MPQKSTGAQPPIDRRATHSPTNTRTLMLVLVFCVVAPDAPAGQDTYRVLDRLTLEGLDVDAMIVDNSHEVVIFDCASARFLRFLEVDQAITSDEFSFRLAEDALQVRWDASCAGWMQHDHSNGNTYVLSQNTQESEQDIDWQQMRVQILKRREFSHNILINPDGDVPADGPVDFRYSVSGFALKPPDAESGAPGRLIIDDTVKGNLDFVELSDSGLSSAGVSRFSYRDRIDCDWPPEDTPPWRCTFNRLPGNSVVLEWLTEKHLPAPGLNTTDELYLLDPRGPTSVIRRFELSHGSKPVTVSELSSLNITDADPFLSNGARGLTLSPSADRLYISTRLQSFSQGWMVIASTANQTQTLVNPTFGDEASPLIDRADPDRSFLVVSDSFLSKGPLILRVMRNGVVVHSVTVMDSLPFETPVLTHDAVYGLLYVAVGDQLVILQGPADLVFRGGFD